MAKLSAEKLEEGREYIINNSLDEFRQWMKDNTPLIDDSVVINTLQTCAAAKDTEKALKLFDAVFSDIDPQAQLFGACLSIAISCVILLGVIGGIVYLITSVL